MKKGYFNADGNVLLVSNGISMEPPEGTAYTAVLPREATVKNIYYADGDFQFKQEFPVIISRNLISVIPAGTIANGIQVDDGELEFQADVEEVITVTLDHPHYIYEAVKVETRP